MSKTNTTTICSIEMCAERLLKKGQRFLLLRPSFPRKRESRVSGLGLRPRMPAFAGMTRRRLRATSPVCESRYYALALGLEDLWDPAPFLHRSDVVIGVLVRALGHLHLRPVDAFIGQQAQEM